MNYSVVKFLSRESILFLDVDRGNLSFSLPFLSPPFRLGGTKDKRVIIMHFVSEASKHAKLNEVEPDILIRQIVG